MRKPKTVTSDRYLHVILLLTDHGRPAETNEVAARVGVSAAAASRMLKTLAKRKLVDLEPYQGARLTTDGLHRALRVLRRHRLLELFLHKVMGFEINDVHLRALAMQSAVDESFEDRLDEMLDHPKVDPHGQPIPSKNVSWPKLGDARLTDLPPGAEGVVSRITSDDFATHVYLREQGVRAGARVALVSIAPFDGPVTIRLAGQQRHLGPTLAKLIFVDAEPGLGQDIPAASPRKTRQRNG